MMFRSGNAAQGRTMHQRMWPRAVMLLLLQLGVVACGGGGIEQEPDSTADLAREQTSVSLAPGPATSSTSTVITGKATYIRVPHNPSSNGLSYSAQFSQPVRGAVVELVDSDGLTLASASTDERGGFNFTADVDQEVSIRVKAMMQKSGSPAWDIRVVDNVNLNALYALTSDTFVTSGQNMTFNLEAASGWTGAQYTELRAAAPFAVLDTVYDSVQKVLEVRPFIQLPSLELNWSVDNRPTSGSFDDGEIGNSLFRPAGGGREIYIVGAANADTDEYDPHVIAHEFSHYLHFHFGRMDSMGGSHSVGDRLDPRMAFDEGLASAFSAIILNDSNYVDTLGFDQTSGVNIDIEHNNLRNKGWYNEGSVQAVIYDLYDAHDDDNDRLAMGFPAIYDTLTGALKTEVAFVTIHSFIDALKKDHSAVADMIDEVAAMQNVATIDAFGTGEINSASKHDKVLPIYTELPFDGSVVTLCTIAGNRAFGTNNRLGNRRFLKFRVTDAEPNTATVITATGPADSDPELILHKAGRVQSSLNSQHGSEQLRRFFTRGDYVLEVYEYTNTTDEPMGDVCFDLSVSTG